MQRRQAFKYELKPNTQQELLLRQFAGSGRFVYNKALALQKHNHEKGIKYISYFSLCKILTQWRHDPDTAFLGEAPVHALQQKLKDLDRAYKNFFTKQAAFPRFKKKGNSDSFRYPDPNGLKVDESNNRAFLPKLGWMKYRNSRPVQGTIKNITISHTANKWFMSIQTEREVQQPLPDSATAVGIDMGVVRFATLSDGTHVEPLNSFKKHQDALRKAQQAFSRKRRYSNNWRKNKTRIQRIHAAIRNARMDYLHKTSTTISKNHAMVCIEDLQITNMTRSAAGTTDNPGKNVKVKSGLNKAILDQSWNEFRRQLDYKLAWNGARLIAVSARNTSRQCPQCSHTSKNNRLTQAHFSCTVCGFTSNADLVAALNILRAGHAQIACQVNGEVMPSATGTHRSATQSG